MIKLQALVSETQGKLPHPKLAEYLLKKRTEHLSTWLYHGTPLVGLKRMLTQGIYGTQHGEIAEYETLSTSFNSEVLRLFSDGDGETGIQFHVKDVKVLILDDLLTYFAIKAAGSGMEVDVDEKLVQKFARVFKLPLDRFNNEPHFPYGYLSSIGVDALCYEYAWKRAHNGYHGGDRDESEVCFIGNGVHKLNNFITEIYIQGEVFEDKAQALAALQDVENEEEYD